MDFGGRHYNLEQIMEFIKSVGYFNRIGGFNKFFSTNKALASYLIIEHQTNNVYTLLCDTEDEDGEYLGEIDLDDEEEAVQIVVSICEDIVNQRGCWNCVMQP